MHWTLKRSFVWIWRPMWTFFIAIERLFFESWQKIRELLAASETLQCNSLRGAIVNVASRDVKEHACNMSSRYRITTCVRRVLRVLAGTTTVILGFAQKQKRVAGPYLTLPDSPYCVNFHVVTTHRSTFMCIRTMFVQNVPKSSK